MKCLFFVLFFILVFFSSTPTIFAQTSPDITNPASSTTPVEESTSLLDWLFSFFVNINSYFSKDYQITPANVYDKSAFTNYDQTDKDITFRSFSDKDRDSEKKAYIYDVVAGKYEDRLLGNCSENPVMISDLQGYSPNPEEYQSTPSCLTTLYDGLQIVPQGDKVGAFSQKNAAPVSSKQLNDNLRTPIPQEKQSTEEPSFWTNFLNSIGLIDQAANENKQQEKDMLTQFIPEKGGPVGENTDLKRKFTRFMYPDSWQKNPPSRSDGSNDPGPDNVEYTTTTTTGSKRGGHNAGLSQYGAQGRALSGQDYKEILKAYYGENTTIKDNDFSTSKIQTDSGSSLDFETEYLLGIAEMPDSWSMEALKAQAVAARTYAYVYTRSLTKSVCTDTRCQVFNPQHITSSPRWKQAVEETKGQILVDNTTNLPFSTMYRDYHQGLSDSYTSLGHLTASIDDTIYEQKANAPY